MGEQVRDSSSRRYGDTQGGMFGASGDIKRGERESTAVQYYVFHVLISFGIFAGPTHTTHGHTTYGHARSCAYAQIIRAHPPLQA